MALPPAGQHTPRLEAQGLCFACFDGAYPLQVPQQLSMDKLALES